MGSEMSADVKKEIQLEIGHVLFIDIVGYSKLLITEQSEQMQKLREIVRRTEQFRLAEAEGQISCVYRPAMAAHWSFAPVLNRQCCARWRLAKD